MIPGGKSERETANAMGDAADQYLPSPVACERLADVAARFGGSLVVRPGEPQMNYALPEHASAEIRDFLRPHATVRFEPAGVARLPGGRVFGSGNVLSPDGATIARDVSSDFGKAFEDHWLLGYKKIRPPVPMSGSTAVIATILGMGYSHWLLEELPRLLALDTKEVDTVIAHIANSYNREAFALRGFPGKVIEAKRNSHFVCDQLIVPTLGRLTFTSIRLLEEFTGPLVVDSSPPSFGERLYISRENARRRRVSNESELWAKLAARGFVALHLEELTWSQQINAFRGAKIIVGAHGAGLANLAFCQAGAKVVELFHRRYVNACFWQLAALKNLDYRPVVSSGPEPLTQSLDANRLDIQADVLQLLAALQA